jgi:hypothetical protein
MKLLVALFSSTLVLPAPSCIQISPATPRSQVSQPIPITALRFVLSWIQLFALIPTVSLCLRLGHDHFLPYPSLFTINEACYSLKGLHTYHEDVLNAPSTPPVCCLKAPELSADGCSFYTQ